MPKKQDLEQQREEAIERWKKAGLLNGLNDNIKKNVAQLFHGQQFYVIKEGDDSKGFDEAFKNFPITIKKAEMEGIQKLILAKDVFDALANGKTCTIRKGRRDIKLGFLTFESLEQKREEVVFVKRVIYCTLRNIPVEYVINDGFMDHDDMEIQMKRFYPDIDQGTECTVVEFNSQY